MVTQSSLFVWVFSHGVFERFSECGSYCKCRQLCWEGKVLFAFLSFSSLSIFLPLFVFSEEEEGAGRCIFDTQMTVSQILEGNFIYILFISD